MAADICQGAWVQGLLEVKEGVCLPALSVEQSNLGWSDVAFRGVLVSRTYDKQGPLDAGT